MINWFTYDFGYFLNPKVFLMLYNMILSYFMFFMEGGGRLAYPIGLFFIVYYVFLH